MTILKTINLKKHYGTEPNVVKALDGVSLEIEAGEFIAIIGMSGSGKSTLLHMLGGLDNPTDGKVIVSGRDISEMKDRALSVFRRRNIGFVFQSYNLIPIISVYENIVLPLDLDGGKYDKAFVDDIISTLGLSEKRDAMPNNLSGGQAQRVAVARALVAKPSVILADEPTGNLDSKTSQDVMGLLKLCSTRFRQTLVMITHNDQIAQGADRILHIEDGRIVADTKAGV
jgi:putative ABC transport system ATP-binding protein